ncbi:MAG: hypothetical protein IKP64_04295 [Selenomonadaceae bacterium]|nr:hypothetical protein [Selenomonadaceae bacterium]
MLVRRFSLSYITLKQVKPDSSRYAVVSLGGRVRQHPEDYWYENNNLEHGYTPFPGAFEIETALRRKATSKRIINQTLSEFKTAFIFFTACKNFSRSLLKSAQTIFAPQRPRNLNVITANQIYKQ